MKNLIIFLLLLILVGCQVDAQKSINLEEIGVDFNIKGYIKPYEDKRSALQKKSKMFFKKIFTDKNASKQDTLAYKKIQSELLEINSFKVDSLYHVIDEEKIWSDENKKKWAVSCGMMSYASIDRTSYFKSINFPKVSFLQDLKGGFIAVSATTHYRKPNPKDFKSLYKYLCEKYGKPKVKKIRAMAKNKYSFQWVGEKLVYNMISDVDEYSFENTKYNLHFYVINKKYNEFVRGKIGIGDWIDLK